MTYVGADILCSGGQLPGKRVSILINAVGSGIRERFSRAYKNQKYVGNCVAVGGEHVESYNQLAKTARQ